MASSFDDLAQQPRARRTAPRRLPRPRPREMRRPARCRTAWCRPGDRAGFCGFAFGSLAWGAAGAGACASSSIGSTSLRTQPAGVVAAQGIDVGQRPRPGGADLDDHAAVGVVGGGRIRRWRNRPRNFTFGVLVGSAFFTTNSPMEVARRPTLKSPLRPWMVLMASWPGR